MADTSETQFSVETPKSEFQKHLELENNYRILFSGMFGSGKTHFLKEFFSNNGDYRTIHLYPVNYSVAKSEDIFDLIKFDILLELLKDAVLEQQDVSDALLASHYIFINRTNISLDFLSSFIGMCGAVGKGVAGLIEKFKLHNEGFNDYKRMIREDSEKNLLENFLQRITNDKGIYNEDLITTKIRALIGRLKEDVGDKGEEAKSQESVLIIDDLDRLDPEHIFRILNVFAAHFDLEEESKNKFGFDRIIVVCDEANVYELFKHKYGMNVDYNGYIDKFFSREIFEFYNPDIYPDIVSRAISNTNFEGVINANDWPNLIDRTLRFMLHSFFTFEIINVRNVIKVIHNSEKVKSSIYNFDYRDLYDVDSRIFPGLAIINYLSSLIGSSNALLESLEDYVQLDNSLEKCHFYGDFNNYSKSYPFVQILTMDRDSSSEEPANSYIDAFQNGQSEIKFKYNWKLGFDTEKRIEEVLIDDVIMDSNKKIPFFRYLYKAVKMCVENDLVK